MIRAEFSTLLGQGVVLPVVVASLLVLESALPSAMSDSSVDWPPGKALALQSQHLFKLFDQRSVSVQRVVHCLCHTQGLQRVQGLFQISPQLCK